jgi:N-acetylglucosamine-6-phosphate deacetylase
MTSKSAICARKVFDGDRFHENAAILIERGRVSAIVERSDVPPAYQLLDSGADILCPGFVDWQVNGGGGVLFNTTPTATAVGEIAAAHARFGTTTILPTVITDARDVAESAANAVAEALSKGIPGIAGVHFEGPHISVEKRGVHDPSFIRPMEMRDRTRLMRGDLGTVVATVAPENTTDDDVRALSGAGVCVSLGHTAAGYDRALRTFAAGARAVTHLFNAMSPLHHRDPGVAGAALDSAHVCCGLIADGHHVHETVLRMAVRSFPHGRLTLVTDAMSSVGSVDDTFDLNGRTVRRDGGRLTVADGTLAGSDLDMISAVRFMIRNVGVPVETALQMASRFPARMLGLENRGRLASGTRADILALDAELDLMAVWISGERVNLQVPALAG